MQTRTNRTGIPGADDGWVLAENAVMPLPRGRCAKLVRVESGTVLITQEGDLEDHVLVSGDELLLHARGLAVAWAFTKAALSVRRAPW
jgi:Protein of unknown function (DUF2917)